MDWKNVKLILARELKVQLRDRRTLFTVLVLPLLLYPLMGMAMLQVSQFSHQKSVKVWMAGAENLPAEPALLEGDKISLDLLPLGPKKADIKIEIDSNEEFLKFARQLLDSEKYPEGKQVVNDFIQNELKKRGADLAVIVPNPITVPVVDETAADDETAAKAENGCDTNDSAATGSTNAIDSVYVFRNSANDKSNMAAEQFGKVLGNWQKAIAFQVLAEKDVDLSTLGAVNSVHTDVADSDQKQAATWSKILPFIILIWSLTGAFYPAVDLCAGEKERGTFETLLSSPALRSEIAIAKLLTVMAFSMTTSLLNLLSMGFTGLFVVSRLSESMGGDPTAMPMLGLPPVSCLFWLLLALVPISALFSAVALAAASFAKSSKEGQYYLVPLMMISMPLMMLPMTPAAKLDFGTSLIPVSGLMLMLRGLIEGQYAEVARYVGPVVAVTLGCCWLAIRWVVIQFNSESVIFRPSERFSVTVWIRKVFLERDIPVVGHAILCGILILVAKFFVSMGASVPLDWFQFSKQAIVMLVATVALPAVLMAMFLSRDPMRSLRLRGCRAPVACAAVLAAICLHPAVMWLTNLVMAVYPASGDLAFAETIMTAIFADAPGLWAILLVIALAPAVFEELAFRGFILSGCQSLGSNFKAILISSILFGLAHSILQQSIITFFLGCLIGFIAVRTKSLIPCILYHFIHNGISVCISLVNEETLLRYPMLQYFLTQSEDGGFEYLLVPAVAMSLIGGFLIFWFYRYQVGDEGSGTKQQTTKPMNLTSSLMPKTGAK